MKRRKFFKNAGLSVLGTAIPFKGQFLSFNDELLSAAISCAEINDRVLVILRLQGANDGLNTFVPYNQYNEYAKQRPNISLPKSSLTSLDSSTASLSKNVLLHPAMSPFKRLYDDGKMSLIHAVGYSNYNYSHFSSDQVWWTGNNGGSDPKDGLFARYISKGYNTTTNVGIENKGNKDPYVIHLGNPVQLVSFRLDNGTSFEFNGTNFLKKNARELSKTASQASAYNYKKADYHKLLSYIDGIEELADGFATAVQKRFDSGANYSGKYGKGTLNQQLKLVARLIKGGAKTKIYQCSLGGFDTHHTQVDRKDRTKGAHSNLLNEVSSSINAFMDDLKIMGLENRVLLMSYSEFGRKVIDNGSGTDHGNLNPMFLVGGGVNAGIVGNHPDLTKIDKTGRFLESETQFNYREVYASVLKNWLGANDTILSTATKVTKYNSALALVAGSKVAGTSCSLLNAREASDSQVFTNQSSSEPTTFGFTVYPNPSSKVIYIKSQNGIQSGSVQASIYDDGGHLIYSKPYNLSSNSGIDISSYRPGIYILKAEDGFGGTTTHKIIKE